MRQLQFFTRAEVAGMRDRTASRKYSLAGEEFRRVHARHRAWGLTQRHAERLRRRNAAAPQAIDLPPNRIEGQACEAVARPPTPEPSLGSAPMPVVVAEPARTPASAAKPEVMLRSRRTPLPAEAAMPDRVAAEGTAEVPELKSAPLAAVTPEEVPVPGRAAMPGPDPSVMPERTSVPGAAVMPHLRHAVCPRVPQTQSERVRVRAPSPRSVLDRQPTSGGRPNSVHNRRFGQREFRDAVTENLIGLPGATNSGVAEVHGKWHHLRILCGLGEWTPDTGRRDCDRRRIAAFDPRRRSKFFRPKRADFSDRDVG